MLWHIDMIYVSSDYFHMFWSVSRRYNNNTNAQVIVLSSTAPAICESSLWFLWAKVGQRQVAANS